MLDAFIVSLEEIPEIWMIRYMIGTGETCSVLGATFSGNEKHGIWGRAGYAGQVHVDVISVLYTERKKIEISIIQNAFPVLKTWLCGIKGKSETWKETTHSINFAFENDGLTITTN